SAASASLLSLPPPTRAGNGCFPNTTRNRNTIPIKAKSFTPKSCCRPTPRRSTQTAIRCGMPPKPSRRSEEHTSELQSRFDLVCRLLLEKKKHKNKSKG